MRQLAAGSERPQRVRTPPSLDVHRGVPVRPLEDGVGVVEQEDRLELRARRAQQPEAAFLRTGVGALVRQDLPALVRRHLDAAANPSRVRATPSGPV